MKFFVHFPFRWGQLLLLWIFVSSCLKNSDDTANGPKSELAVHNFVVTGNLLDAWSDNNKITNAPLPFGSATGTAAAYYTPVGTGLHALKITLGTATAFAQNLYLEQGTRYSLFAYDSLKNNMAKVLLLKDDTTTVDTLARARFLQFIPGADTLTLVLLRNNTGYTVADTYIGNGTVTGTESAFSLVVPPGTYSLALLRNNLTVAQLPTFTALPRKLYTFISKGVVNGTGIYQQSIEVVQHN